MSRVERNPESGELLDFIECHAATMCALVRGAARCSIAPVIVICDFGVFRMALVSAIRSFSMVTGNFTSTRSLFTSSGLISISPV